MVLYLLLSREALMLSIILEDTASAMLGFYHALPPFAIFYFHFPFLVFSSELFRGFSYSRGWQFFVSLFLGFSSQTGSNNPSVSSSKVIWSEH